MAHNKTMATKANSRKLLNLPPARDVWERGWRDHWRKASLSSYELPGGAPGSHDRELLNQTRSPAKEIARLKRINDEFARAFKALYQLGPAVTVFGSARFDENH